MTKTMIELTEKEAELFLRFRQYQDLWYKVFKIKDGSVELHFDSQGVISKVGYNQVEKIINRRCSELGGRTFEEYDDFENKKLSTPSFDR